MELLLFAITILPVILIGIYIYKKDRNKESHKLLLKLFLGGMFSCIMVLIISKVIYSIFPFFNTSYLDLNLFELFIWVFIGIALIEEVCKWIITYFVSYNNVEFDEIMDGIVYGVFVALGFAFFENLTYVYGYGFSTGLMRAITAVPLHASAGILMGYYLGLSKQSKYNNRMDLSRKYLVFSILWPVILHGVYNYCVFSGNEVLMVFFYVLIVVMYIISFIKIRQLSRIKTKMIYKDSFCPNCGSIVNSDFCPKCGKKHD